VLAAIGADISYVVVVVGLGGFRKVRQWMGEYTDFYAQLTTTDALLCSC
jgi:hypothetical protein